MSKFIANFQKRHLPQQSLSFEDSGLPESYRDLYNANPWAGRIATGGFLGLGQRQQQQEFDTNSAQYISDLIASYRKEQYEAPLQASARERLAGLNPDLIGLDQAGSAGDAPSHFPFPSQDVGQQVGQVANSMLSIASIATGIPTFIADLSGKLLENRGQVIDNLLKMGELVDDDAGNLQPILDLPEDASAVNVLSAAGKVFKRSEDLAGAFFPNDKKMQDLFIKQYQSRQDSLKNQLSRFGSLKDLINLQNSPEFTDVELIRDMAKTYALYQLESLKNQLWREEQIRKYRSDHPDSLSEELSEKHTSVLSEEFANQAESSARQSRAEYDKGVVSGLSPSAESGAQNLKNIEDQFASKQAIIDQKFIQQWEDIFESDPSGRRYRKEVLHKKPHQVTDEDQIEYLRLRRKFKEAKKRTQNVSPSRTKLSLGKKGIGLEF